MLWKKTVRRIVCECDPEMVSLKIEKPVFFIQKQCLLSNLCAIVECGFLRKLN